MESFNHDGKKVIWEVFGDYVVEEATDYYQIGIGGVDFNFFDNDENGEGREGSSEFPSLLNFNSNMPWLLEDPVKDYESEGGRGKW